MANRSMLFAASAMPDGTARQELKTIGLCEFDYDIPAIFKVLVSCSPQLCRSCVFKKKAKLAVAGNAKEGLDTVKKLRSDLPNTAESIPAIDHLIAFLDKEHNQYPFYLLEPAEVFDMSGDPLPPQVKDLLNEISVFDVDSLRDRSIDRCQPAD